MKDKILIIDIKKTEITSVENISRNLVKSYQLLKNKDYDIEHFVLDDLSRTAPALNNYNPFFDSIVKNPPQLVAFTHSYVVRTYFFKILIQLLNKEKTTLIFHIYGDFLRQAFKYTEVEKRLLNFRIHFISPSRSYLNLLSTLFKEKRDIKVIEFAVDYKKFFYTNKQRQDIRKKIGIEENDFLFIYTGRISSQKNVHHLWSIIEKLQITNPKLLIIGPFCDFENATFGTSLILGSSFADCENSFTNKNIIFLSHQNTQEINNYYSASDMFISASLFHDEDFGCAPIEASFSGLPLVLTGWGGYLDIGKSLKRFANILPVYFDQTRSRYVIEIPNDFKFHKLTNIERKELSELAIQTYSIEAISKKIYNLVQTSANHFSGFNKNMQLLSPNKKNEITSDDYNSLYENFWKENE
jgi:glycosyltransferase involved in cell wall biosynthesis